MLTTTGIVALPLHGTRRAEFPEECGQRYCAGALVSGEVCRFDAECESGSCMGAGECGDPKGTCQ